MQKICIIGDGLAGLTTAITLSKEHLEIDLYAGIKKKYIQTEDNRTTAISDSNYHFIKKELTLNKFNFFWPCKNINLFLVDDRNVLNFLNFKEKYKNLMYVFQNKKLKKLLEKKILEKKNINLTKKNIKYISHKNGYILVDKKKKLYDLIILCVGNNSELYNKIDQERSIKKDYRETAMTTNITHDSKIQNASQFFLKEGPLAILPFQKKIFSVVWSVQTSYFQSNKKNLEKILQARIKKLLKINKIKKISSIQSFPINLNLKTRYFNRNILILGDGLHSVHPLAGQGFNMVLRDIKKLKELLSKNLRLGLLIKNSFLLKNFYYSRKPENTIVGLGIDLTNLFFKDNKYFSSARKTILTSINKFNFIKKISKNISDRGFSL